MSINTCQKLIIDTVKKYRTHIQDTRLGTKQNIKDIKVEYVYYRKSLFCVCNANGLMAICTLRCKYDQSTQFRESIGPGKIRPILRISIVSYFIRLNGFLGYRLSEFLHRYFYVYGKTIQAISANRFPFENIYSLMPGIL